MIAWLPAGLDPIIAQFEVLHPAVMHNLDEANVYGHCRYRNDGCIHGSINWQPWSLREPDRTRRRVQIRNFDLAGRSQRCLDFIAGTWEYVFLELPRSWQWREESVLLRAFRAWNGDRPFEYEPAMTEEIGIAKLLAAF